MSLGRTLVRALLLLAVASAIFSVSVDAKRSRRRRSSGSSIDTRVRDRCEQCKKITAKFIQEFERTKTSIHFHGESTGWSEDNEKFLGKYEMDEARLVEIVDNICDRDHKCGTLLEELEESIEEWWGIDDKRESADGLEHWLCVEQAQLCCPKGHYGKSCKACPGMPKANTESGAEDSDNDKTICNGHGDCEGDGTRTGSGRCKCKDNFSGKNCDSCRAGYFLQKSDGEAGKCVACHASCRKECDGPTSSDCEACATGYKRDGETGPCEDVDECSNDTSPCGSLSFCKNKPGSYECVACNKACKEGCTGDGPSHCVGECNDGFRSLEEGGCEDVNECQLPETECGSNEFCSNSPGSFECKPCNMACHGCSGASTKDCKDCADGFQLNEEGTCEDVDECKAFPCADAHTCVNTAGGYECVCKSPAVQEQERCTYPANVTDILNRCVDSKTTNEDDLKGLEGIMRGKAVVGPSAAPTAVLTVDLKHLELNHPPLVLRVAPHEPCCGDQFEARIGAATESSLEVAVTRTDTQTGWDQELRIEYVLQPEKTSEQHEEL